MGETHQLAMSPTPPPPQSPRSSLHLRSLPALLSLLRVVIIFFQRPGPGPMLLARVHRCSCGPPPHHPGALRDLMVVGENLNLKE